MNPCIRECFRLAVPDESAYGREKTQSSINRDALMLMKQVESVLEYMLEQDFDDMTLQELYNEISGQAHFG